MVTVSDLSALIKLASLSNWMFCGTHFMFDGGNGC